MKTPAASDEGSSIAKRHEETVELTFGQILEMLKDYESALIRYENMALGHDENGKLNMVARAVLDKYGVKR